MVANYQICVTLKKATGRTYTFLGALHATFCSVLTIHTGLNEITNQECKAGSEMEGYMSLTRTIVW